jgi:integrase/recombinase XerD
MLVELCPRAHARYTSLPLLGPHVEAFAAWLVARGYPRLYIRRRLSAMPRLEMRLRRRGVRRLEDLCDIEMLRFAPRHVRDDVLLSAVVRSLTRYLNENGVLAHPELTPSEQLTAAYRRHLHRTRGLAAKTLKLHSSTAAALLSFLDFDRDRLALHNLGSSQIEAFIRAISARLSRESLQHAVAYVRSFLRFLAGRNEVHADLSDTIDTPRVYRQERLPRALAWAAVQAFLAAIDRSSAMGRRDHTMFLLMATYGLRAGEVAALRLDDIDWRAGKIRVSRSKTCTPLELPLTDEVGAALVDYLRHARPQAVCREIFLRLRLPTDRIGSTTVSEAFRTWARRGALPTGCGGPHCLRHSLAMHLLREGISLKSIGDLLGHRSTESTCVYLRLQVEDLCEAALPLPSEVSR